MSSSCHHLLRGLLGGELHLVLSRWQTAGLVNTACQPLLYVDVVGMDGKHDAVSLPRSLLCAHLACYAADRGEENAVFQRELPPWFTTLAAVNFFSLLLLRARRLGARGARVGCALAWGVLRRILGLTAGLQRRS